MPNLKYLMIVVSFLIDGFYMFTCSRIFTPVCSLVLLADIFLITPVQANGIQFSELVPNFVGIGAGSTSQWSGADDQIVGAVPGGRMKLEDNRYAEWYGPYASMKVNSDKHFEYGPVALIKLGRSEVDNRQVDALPEIGMGLEVGGFVGYAITRTDTVVPFYSRVGMMASTAVAGDAKGTNLSFYANTWVPLSYKLFVGLGVGTTFADGKYMQHNFGVDAIASQQSGISEYDASGGNRQIYAWPALLYQINPQWYVATGAYYQRLTGNAAASSIVKQAGDRNQLTYGVGVGYAW